MKDFIHFAFTLYLKFAPELALSQNHITLFFKNKPVDIIYMPSLRYTIQLVFIVYSQRVQPSPKLIIEHFRHLKKKPHSIQFLSSVPAPRGLWWDDLVAYTFSPGKRKSMTLVLKSPLCRQNTENNQGLCSRDFSCMSFAPAHGGEPHLPRAALLRHSSVLDSHFTSTLALFPSDHILYDF